MILLPGATTHRLHYHVLLPLGISMIRSLTTHLVTTLMSNKILSHIPLQNLLSLWINLNQVSLIQLMPQL